MLTYLQAVILGIVQGVTELFPVSSLGHSVLLANLFGWHDISKQQMADNSAYVVMLAMMYLATALALIIFYRKDWIRAGQGFIRSVRIKNPSVDSDSKLAWLLIAALVPAGLMGLLFETGLRSLFATTFFVIIFMTLNGILLIRGDRQLPVQELSRPRNRKRDVATDEHLSRKTTRVVSDRFTYLQAAKIGFAQIAPLFAGISRTGITMLLGLRSGLSHRDAARFSFLVTTIILIGTAVLKLPALFHGAPHGAMGPIWVGTIVAGISAYLSVRYLDGYFKTKSLRPFGWYCIGIAVFMLLVSIIRGSS